MSLSVWDYLRRRACQAFLAGVQDALDQVERQDQSQQIYAAANALRKRMHECPGPAALPPKPDGAPAAEKSPAPPPPPNGSPAKPPPAPPPAPSNGVPPPGHPTQSQDRRKPGRPRKETYG